MGETKNSKEKYYVVIAIIFFVFVSFIMWDRYRAQLTFTNCEEVSKTGSQSYDRANLPGTSSSKTYEELLNECLIDFGYGY